MLKGEWPAADGADIRDSHPSQTRAWMGHPHLGLFKLCWAGHPPGLTLSCADSKHKFKVGSTPEQLQKLRNKLEALFVELVETRPSTQA
jgi:hypothetical protein